jgi:hypothetical protein
MRRFLLAMVLVFLFGLSAQPASADTVPLGQISFDTTTSASGGFPGVNSFDLLNFTGGLISPSPGVSDTITLTGQLVVVESIGGAQTTITDPFSAVGPGVQDLGDFSTDAVILSATLTGTLDTTFVTLNGGTSPVTLSQTFTVSDPFNGGVTLVACTGTNDDTCSKGISTATTNVNPVPEPGTLLLLASGLASFYRRKNGRVGK